MGIVTHQFSSIYNREMALEWCRNLVFAQYLENKLMEFDQILHMHWCWQDLGWDCYASIFANLQQSYGLWLISEFRFRSISLEWIHGIWPNVAYALILTTSRMGLLRVNFRKFIRELWPFIDVRISFPLNIMRASWRKLAKFCIWILGRSKMGSLQVHFWKFAAEFWPLIDVRISFRLNILRTTRLEDLTKFYICNWYWRHLGWD